MHYFAATTILAAASGALADTIKITATSEQTFDPAEVTAKEGDILEFHFMPQNHSVAMGEFGSINGACVPANEGGFFSGYIPSQSSEAEDVFRVTVNSTDPMVFYCTQGQHCANGMVGVVNADSELLAGYKENATTIAKAVTPREMFGGEKVKASSVSDDNSDNDSGDKEDGDSGSGDGGSSAGSVKAGLGGVAAAVGVALMMI